MEMDKATLKRVYEAQDLAYEAQRLIGQGDVKGGLALFDRVAKIDPDCVELHTHLAEVHRSAGRFTEAEEALKRAIAVSRERLGGDAPDARVWWGDTETRPYMQAREALAVLYRQAGRHAEAAAEYRALLERNPPDNQGIRWVLGPTLLAGGDLEGALAEFERYARDYKDDVGDPGVCFAWALALYRAHRAGEALRVLRRGFFRNLYLAPELLAREVRLHPIWHSSNLEQPDWARLAARAQVRLWRETPTARELLAKAWDDPETVRDVEAVLEHGRALERLKDPKRRKPHVRALGEIVGRDWSAEFYARMGAEPPATDPLHPAGQRDTPPPCPGEGAAQDDGKAGLPTLREALASGEFERALEETQTGIGHPTTQLGRLLKQFRIETKADLKEACNLAMAAWNSAIDRRRGPARAPRRDGPADPGEAMDAGLQAFHEGDLEGCARRWLEVAREHPAVIDRLLCWDDPAIEERSEGPEDDLAWEYMNTSWWEVWKDDLEAWTALLVFWCQRGVQEAAGAEGIRRRSDPLGPKADAARLATTVSAVLKDEGPVGEAWRLCAEVQHGVTVMLRNMDREGFRPDDLPDEARDATAKGQALVENFALLYGRDGLKEPQARKDVPALRQLRETLQPLLEGLGQGQGAGMGPRDGPRAPIRAVATPARNGPCPCGSGKKYKRCCGRAR